MGFHCFTHRVFVITFCTVSSLFFGDTDVDGRDLLTSEQLRMGSVTVYRMSDNQNHSAQDESRKCCSSWESKVIIFALEDNVIKCNKPSKSF